jgi:MFS family permease
MIPSTRIPFAPPTQTEEETAPDLRRLLLGCNVLVPEGLLPTAHQEDPENRPGTVGVGPWSDADDISNPYHQGRPIVVGGIALQRVLRPVSEYLSGIPPIVRLMAVGRLLNSGARRMAMPFLALYLAEVLHASTSQIGAILALSPLFAILGQGLGGAATDRLGRRPVLLASLGCEALMLLIMAHVRTLLAFAVLNALIGLLGAAYWPVSQAVVADVTSPEERVRSYAFLYFANNIGAAAGPAVGAGLALTGHDLVFSLSAGILLSWVAVLFRYLPDTLPRSGAHQPFGSGYLRALKDRRLLLYVCAAFLANFAYNQLDTSLPLFLVRMGVRDASSVYGAFISSNALMVVALSLSVSRLTEGRSPTRVLAAGAGLYAISLLGLSVLHSTWALLALDVPFTVGEMLGATVSGAYLASLAPEADRGTYMGVSSLSWALSSALAPLATGLLLRRLTPAKTLLLLASFPMVAALLFARQGAPKATPAAGLSVP